MSAYEYFTRHLYNQLHNKEGFGHLSLSEFRKLAEDRWKLMSGSERQSYRDLASASSAVREQFLGAEMPQEEAMASTESGRGRKRKRQTKEKDPNAPKRPTTAFFYFAQEERQRLRDAHPEFKVTEISKELGRMWRELEDEAKVKFQALATADKKRYEEQSTVYKKNREAEQNAGPQEAEEEFESDGEEED